MCSSDLAVVADDCCPEPDDDGRALAAGRSCAGAPAPPGTGVVAGDDLADVGVDAVERATIGAPNSTVCVGSGTHPRSLDSVRGSVGAAGRVAAVVVAAEVAVDGSELVRDSGRDCDKGPLLAVDGADDGRWGSLLLAVMVTRRPSRGDAPDRCGGDRHSRLLPGRGRGGTAPADAVAVALLGKGADPGAVPGALLREGSSRRSALVVVRQEGGCG